MDGPRRREVSNNDATRAALVEAARHVFESAGYEGARVSDIAQAAGVGRGTFYRYFVSKEAIYRSATEVVLSDLYALEPVGGGHSVELVRSLCHRYFTAYRKHLGALRYMAEAAAVSPTCLEDRLAARRQFAARLAEHLAALESAGLAHSTG